MAAIVLDKGESDHAPFIQDFKTNMGTVFRAVTRNIHHGTDADQAEDDLDEIMEVRGGPPSIFLMQEVKPRQKLEAYFRSEGYGFSYAEPEFAIAWDEQEWRFIHDRRVQMSPIKYWTINYALVVVLENLETNERIKFMTYHPPAKVQRPNEKQHEKVLRVLKDVVRKWNRIARNNYGGRIDSVCFAGDDNVDEYRGYKPKGGWAFMLDGPLTQVRAPERTHGRKRRIDDFRVRGMRPI